MILQQITKYFQQKIIINKLDLDLKDSKITALVGASGCGKSTLLKIVAGLLKADAGRVIFNPENDEASSSINTKMAIIFQQPRLLPWLNVAENLALALPTSTKNKQQIIADILQQVELANCSKLMPYELSGGMAQRVGICRALLRQPQWLLLDEPFAALDALTRKSLQQLLLRLVKTNNLRCIFVTHDLDEALLLSDQICVMQQGKIIDTFYKNQSEQQYLQQQILKNKIYQYLNINQNTEE